MADSNVNLPPGFRFDPTDEELLLHFLRRKVARLPSHHPDVIPDLDLLPYSPWELQGKAVSGGGKWYYYSRRTPHRTTDAGYWKQMGRDEAITSRSNNAKIGVKNSWMFHVGQPPEGASTNWMMHQYRLPETAAGATTDGGTSSSRRGHPKQDNKTWILCKVYERRSEDGGDDNGIELSCLDEVFLSMDDFDEISLPN